MNCRGGRGSYLYFHLNLYAVFNVPAQQLQIFYLTPPLYFLAYPLSTNQCAASATELNVDISASVSLSNYITTFGC